MNIKGDPDNIADNLRDYIKGFSENVRTILESFGIYSQIERLDIANLLRRVTIMDNAYQWVPFYEALADKLLVYSESGMRHRS
jgi:hypothetical protein